MALYDIRYDGLSFKEGDFVFVDRRYTEQRFPRTQLFRIVTTMQEHGEKYARLVPVGKGSGKDQLLRYWWKLIHLADAPPEYTSGIPDHMQLALLRELPVELRDNRLDIGCVRVQT